MFQYVLDLNRINGFAAHTLLKQRRMLAHKDQRFATPETAHRFVAITRQDAGMRFLERIHAEVWESMPEVKRKEIEAERRMPHHEAEATQEDWSKDDKD